MIIPGGITPNTTVNYLILDFTDGNPASAQNSEHGCFCSRALKVYNNPEIKLEYASISGGGIDYNLDLYGKVHQAWLLHGGDWTKFLP
jgi:hypothetical protein